MSRIAIFGDSIAWGSWDPECGGWAARLKTEFMRRHSAGDEPDNYIGVHICATPGHRVCDVLARVDSDLQAVQPDYVLIAIGTNDTPRSDRGGTSLPSFERDYREVLAKCLSTTSNITLLTAPNVTGEAYGYTNEEIAKLNRLIEEIAASEHLDVIDIFGILEPDDFVLDGVHPNSQGHERIFRRVLSSIEISP